VNEVNPALDINRILDILHVIHKFSLISPDDNLPKGQNSDKKKGFYSSIVVSLTLHL